MSTTVEKGKEDVAEGSLVKESGSGKKKRNEGSLFRRSSRKKILGASPSSAERWVGLGYMETAVLLDWLKQQVKGYGIKQGRRKYSGHSGHGLTNILTKGGVVDKKGCGCIWGD